MINYVHDDLEHRSNDARTARCASNQNRLVVLENDSRGHGTERAFARRNGIGVALHESVIVRRTGFRSEIIHLVVQKKSRGARDYLGAERVVDGVSDRYRITYPIDYRIMRSAGLLPGSRARTQRLRHAGPVRPNLGPDVFYVAVREQSIHRILHECRIAQKGVAIHI